MSAILKLLEYIIGRLLYQRRAYDSQLFSVSPAFRSHLKPSIPITSPDCGPSGAIFSNHYSQFGDSRIPQLTWQASAIPSNVKELLLLCEDPDAPLGHPNVHGIYCFIPPHVTSFGPEDLKLVDKKDGMKTIASGWRVGKNRRDIVYIAPRPPMGHGPHRYLFELVALEEKLDPAKMSKVPDKKEVEKAIEGKVVAWGVWEASYESTWDRDRVKKA